MNPLCPIVLSILAGVMGQAESTPAPGAQRSSANTESVTPAAMAPALTPEQIDAAVAHGATHKDAKTQGLHLRDVQARDSAYSTLTRTKSSQGFSLTIFTPTTWVRERAAIAARGNRLLRRADISEVDALPLLRVLVYPDIPSYSDAGVWGSTSVRSVYVEDETSSGVLVPLWQKPFEMRITQSVTAARIFPGYMGLTAVFDYAAVQSLRGGAEGEYFVRIVGATGEVKRFKVKRKHFDHIP
jgi:hypothetical protein